VEHVAEGEAIREMIALQAAGKALRAIAEAMKAKCNQITGEGAAERLEGCKGSRSVTKAPPPTTAKLKAMGVNQFGITCAASSVSLRWRRWRPPCPDVRSRDAVQLCRL
jgi:hypothetical protein